MNTSVNRDDIPQSIPIDKRNVFRSTLRAKLTSACCAWEKYLLAAVTLRAYDSFNKHSPIYIDDVLDEVVAGWMDEVCEEATSMSGTSAHLKIDRKCLPEGAGADHLHIIKEGMAEYNFSDMSAVDYVNKVLAVFDADNFITRVSNAMAGIEVAGYKDSALSLALALGFSKSPNNEKYINVKTQGGGYLLEYSNYGYDHERKRKFHNLVAMASTFEHESGVEGLSAVFSACLGAEKDVSGIDGFVASRTRVCKGGQVSGTFYKGKVKLCFSSEVFSALVSFISEYADDDRIASVKVA